MRLFPACKSLFAGLLLCGAALPSVALGQLAWPENTSKSPRAGYDQYNGNPAGAVTALTYYPTKPVYNAKGKPMQQWVNVYTPPGYKPSKRYPVLYLLHGLFYNEADYAKGIPIVVPHGADGTQTNWVTDGNANFILDNLYANNPNMVPMIVVMPSNFVLIPPGPPVTPTQVSDAFKSYGDELVGDLVPLIDNTYKTYASPKGRALAGLSEGGMQAIKFGFTNLNTFGQVGIFSPGPFAWDFPSDDPIPNISNLQLLWLSCGAQDDQVGVSGEDHLPYVLDLIQDLNGNDSFVNAKGNMAIFLRKYEGEHEWSVWSTSLYHFAQRLSGVDTSE